MKSSKLLKKVRYLNLLLHFFAAQVLFSTGGQRAVFDLNMVNNCNGFESRQTYWSRLRDLQRVFRRIYDTKGGVFVPDLPCGDRGNWD